ncbi:putative glucose transporter [Phytophthora cinnamomi]|uniref:putative glucose transporter n=1 Tax=Phytophthora cinnamomi TaxID=4785 RepID=UPI0035594B8A|nr:putative glucose transporter [Phytophthora cinnamomi]
MADNYAEAASPKTANATAFDEANKAAARLIKPKTILYTSALLSWMQPFQSGWSTSQMNLSQYNDTDECNARPVAEDTCLMFPGHSKLEWTFAVNAWIFGAMVGSLCCGHFSDKYGRKKALMGNCIFMIVGGVVQASVSNIWLFSLGRLIAGLSSGTATATIGGYINELSPPHMRNTLGLGLQIFTTIGILVPAICFFFANTSSGWRYLAAFPVVLAVIYLLLAPSMCVESPAWLLTKGRKEEAKQVIARLRAPRRV